ncbi:UvrD-helicase domain-containing protein [Roseateles puraquae]|uniref:UvrD-helicase domain-containing protein n=1 Tax=Roseateles puraquae TaxID=431059 RepID=UPI0031E37EA8
MNTAKAITLLPPPEAAAHFADVAPSTREQEMLRLFEEEGRLHFDLFARLVAQLFQRSDRLARIYCDAYPMIILDEFQDTNADEWALIYQLGRHSRLIALGDPEQRIYEFRGADPRRLGEIVEAFQPGSFDFSGEKPRGRLGRHARPDCQVHRAPGGPGGRGRAFSSSAAQGFRAAHRAQRDVADARSLCRR